MPKAAAQEESFVSKFKVMDDSVEAIVLENDRVDIYLKSGSVIKAQCVDEVHAAIRYDDIKKVIACYGQAGGTEVDDFDDYLKEIEKESSSE